MRINRILDELVLVKILSGRGREPTLQFKVRGGYRIFQKGGVETHDTKCGGGGGGGGGVLSASGPIRKAGGGGACYPLTARYEKRTGGGGGGAV